MQCPSYLYIFMLFGFLWLSQYLARRSHRPIKLQRIHVGEASVKSDSE